MTDIRTMTPVPLRGGGTLPDLIVGQVYESLRELYASDQAAWVQLVRFARSRNYVLQADFVRRLWGFIDATGNLHPQVHRIVIASAYGKGKRLRLDDPRQSN